MSAAPDHGFQQAFARALLDAEQPCPPGLRTWNGSDPSVRFAVYRNNVVSSLVEALADTFPVVRQLVGREFFNALARRFVASHPPTSPVLTQYGAGFAEFIERFEPAARVPYLADVARLERLRVQAFHAADVPSLPALEIAHRLAQPEALADSTVSLHPSLAVLASAFAIVSLWGAHQGAGDIAQVDPMRPECALALRHDDEVLVIGIAAESAAFSRHLAGGATLGEAATAAASCGSGFDLVASLGLLIRHGAVTAWHSPRRPEP